MNKKGHSDCTHTLIVGFDGIGGKQESIHLEQNYLDVYANGVVRKASITISCSYRKKVISFLSQIWKKSTTFAVTGQDCTLVVA